MKMFEFVRNFYRKSYREGDTNTCMQNDPLASTYNFAIYFYNEIYCLLKRYRISQFGEIFKHNVYLSIQTLRFVGPSIGGGTRGNEGTRQNNSFGT